MKHLNTARAVIKWIDAHPGSGETCTAREWFAKFGAGTGDTHGWVGGALVERFLRKLTKKRGNEFLYRLEAEPAYTKAKLAITRLEAGFLEDIVNRGVPVPSVNPCVKIYINTTAKFTIVSTIYKNRK